MNRLRHPYQQFLLLLCAGLCAAGLLSFAVRLNPAAAQTNSQSSADGVWQDLEPAELAQRRAAKLDERGERARVMRLNPAALERLLQHAPREGQQPLANSAALLTLPMPDGSFQRFRLEESSVLAPELAARFPAIKSYRGQGVDNPLLTLRGDWTPQGFHALILSNDATITIHPAGATADGQNAVEQAQTYVSYFGLSDAAAVSNFQCFVNEKLNIRPGDTRRILANTAVGPTRREYRLAVATTGEYSVQFGGGTVGGTVASINTWLNGINAIYEREVALRLTLVNDTDAIYLDGGNDPYTNGNTATMLSEVRPDLNTRIGAANYDIGHVLGTGGGGIAFVGVTCNSNDNAGDGLGPLKGGGVSLVSGALGNSSSLNVFAHEIGHQFGANHTFNTTVSNCGGTGRSADSAVETGAGLTIMSYAGICAPDNLTGNAELRFHTHSYTQISNYVTSGGGNGCATTTNTGNTAPSVDGGADFTIPKQTPFTLTATGSDPDGGDAGNLTFAWEQVDAGGASFINPPYSDAGDAANTTRPIFRPYSPTPGMTRTFPALNYILNNSNIPPGTINGFQTAENLPAVGRALNFRVTARDQRGGVNDDAVQLTVAGTAGPFLVTSQIFSEVWSGGTNRNITWSVNGTNAAPINVTNVRILLSTDGGQTFPIELVSSTPNDGSQSITVPQGILTQAGRVKVQAIGNIFFDINDTNISIAPGDACPAVGSLSPLVNQAGASVLITGTNFDSVSEVRFTPNVMASFTVLASSVISATVPIGAMSGPVTVVKAGCPSVQTPFFTVCPGAPSTLQVDDNSLENALGFPSGATSAFVNRLTPASYPATLSAIIPAINLPIGTQVDLIYGVNADGDNDISGTTFQVLATTVTQQASFTTFNVPPLTITAGDFVVGFRVVPTAGVFPAALDTNSTSAQRSYLSNDGTNFSTFDANGNPGNLAVRALVFTGDCSGGGPTCPTVTGINPGSGDIGATVTITGTNLSGVTGVKFSNNVTAQFTLVNATTVTAVVPSGASTGPLTISKTGCPDVMTQSFTVNCPAITVFPATLPAGTVNVAYSQTITATGGTAPFAFAITAGNLPNGVTLATDGTLSGTALVTGTFNFTVNVTDSAECVGMRAYSVQFNCQSITVNPATLPAGVVNSSYGQSLSHVGGIGNVSWMVSAGVLPNGLTLSPSGVLAGTPTQTGSFSFTAQVTDSNGCTGTRVYELLIACQAITVNPATLAAAALNQPFNQTFTPVGGVGTISWQLTGTTPPGLTFNSMTGVLSGSPTQLGNSNFTITATDANSCAGARTYTLTVGNCIPLTLTPATLPAAAVNQPYTQTVSATGGTGPYSFAIVAGALPTGLMFLTGGAFSGSPTVGGSFNFTVRGTDATGCTGDRAYTLQVGCPTITINPTSLPSGTQGTNYNQMLSATGGNGSYTFALINGGGSLPPGINLAPNGTLSGTPVLGGSFSFAVTATDTTLCLGSRAYTLNIAQTCPSLTINPPTLPNGTTGSGYNQSLSVTGGTPPYSFGLDSGALPLGLFLTSSGQIIGTPQQNGVFNFAIIANDVNNCAMLRNYSITINCSTLTVNPPTLPHARLNRVYNQQLSVTGGLGATTWSLDSGTLPPGITLSVNGLLAGIPTTLGSYNFVIRAVAASGCSNTRAYAVNVLRGLVKADFDGDGLTDLSVWRPGNGTWYTVNSSDKAMQSIPWGAGYAPYFDVIVPGDYDGDGLTDHAIWRGADSIWYIRKSSDGQPIFDLWGANYEPYLDIPTPGDFDGDGKTDIAVWRRDGTWFVKRSSNGSFLIQTHGQAGDIPVAADYDGDGTTDFAVFRPSVVAPTPNWIILNSSTNTVSSILWGAGYAPYNDTPVPADYDGDGKADLAIWRGGDSTWYVRKSSDGQVILQLWGASYAPYFDIPTPGDFDGDGKADLAVWRRTGTWFVIRSSDGSFLIQSNGQTGDVPVPANGIR